MRKIPTAFSVLTSVVTLACASAVMAAETGLPVERVVLSTAGVAYFEHGGKVQGDASVTLRFTAPQLNDLLKSLVVQDFDGGRLGTVGFPGQDPLDRILGSFSVNLAGEPSLGELLSQLRGAVARIAVEGGEMLEGSVLGVERRQRATGETVIEQEVVSLLGDTGIRSVALDDVRRIEFVDAALQQEFRRALAALADNRDSARKPVTIAFLGKGERRVALGYVVEAPLWKSSYRLVLPEGGDGKAHLQGWAVVENTTEQDWRGVELALISGQPLAFVEDLYGPKYLQRPIYQSARAANIAPQAYAGGMAVQESSADYALEGMPMAAAAPVPAPAPMMAARARAKSIVDDIAGSVDSAARTEAVGSDVRFVLDGIDIDRQRSAMLPIVNTAIDAEAVTIYDSRVLAEHPLQGVRLRNTSGQPLPGGPLTVLSGNHYAGDARIEYLPADESRLLSFAVDLPISVQQRQKGAEQTVQALRIVRGMLESQVTTTRGTSYAFRNAAKAAREVLVVHPLNTRYELLEPAQADERTNDDYRFKLTLAAGEEREFQVREQRVHTQTVALLDGSFDAAALIRTDAALSEPLRVALAKMAELQGELASAESERDLASSEIDVLVAEQERVRDNLGAATRGTQLAERLLGKLNEQETAIEDLQKRRQAAVVRAEGARKALQDYIATLDVGG